MHRSPSTAAHLQRAAPGPRTLYIATAGVPEIAEGVRRIADALAQAGPADLRWHHEPMPGEQHETILHVAALRAFRSVFAPARASASTPAGAP